jgi:hypothetical protein
MELRGKYTLIGEGARGSVAKKLIERFGLSDGKDPQKFGIGLKELWRVKPEKHKPGTVQHTMGWPLDNQTGGGSFLYHWGDNLVSVGFVVHLNYRNPWISPFEEFQRMKTHPKIRDLFEGAERLGLFTEPFADRAERAGIAAMIGHEGREGEIREAEATGFRQGEEDVVLHLGLKRTALILPVRQQFVQRLGIDHHARQDMRADLGAFFQHRDGNLVSGLGGHLFQADRGGQAGRTGAHDDDVIFHGLALDIVCHVEAAPCPAVFRFIWNLS